MTTEAENFTAEDIAAATAAALELREAPQPIILEFSAYDAYLLVGLMQLSLKATQLPLYSRLFAVGMVETLRVMFEAMGCVEVVRQIESGPRT